jgi:acetyl esterase/lipase
VFAHILAALRQLSTGSQQSFALLPSVPTRPGHAPATALAIAVSLLTGAGCLPLQSPIPATPVSTADWTPIPTLPPTLIATASPTVSPPGQATLTPLPAAAFFELSYAAASPSQKLDLYTPPGLGPFPLIVYIHGGGWIIGDKAEPRDSGVIGFLIGRGYAVASLNYRFSDEATFPAQVHDVKAAVRWLRANASQYRLDAVRLGAWGESAGGNLAAMLGTSCGVAELEGGALGNPEQSSCVQAVVDWYGPMDFLTMDAQFAGTTCPQNHSQGNSFESDYVGGPILRNPDVVRRANPTTYVSADDAPFLIQHGTRDCAVPPQQSQLLYDLLAPHLGAGNVVLHYLEGAEHAGTAFVSPENLNQLVVFLDAHLR